MCTHRCAASQGASKARSHFYDLRYIRTSTYKTHQHRDIVALPGRAQPTPSPRLHCIARFLAGGDVCHQASWSVFMEDSVRSDALSSASVRTDRC